MLTQIEIPETQLKAIRCVLAEQSFHDYCKIVDSESFYDEENADYLKEICDALQEFENDDNQLIVINEPPRHGKTRTIRDYIQWLIGRNPLYRIMFGCYNTNLSRISSKSIRNKIMEQSTKSKITFNDVFEDVRLKYGSTSTDMWGTEASEEDNFLATAPNGSATGIGCDFLILDDTIKSKYEAYHKELKRQLFEDWFKNTLYSRLEGKRKIIVVMTRWATDDMAGRMIEMFEEQGRKYRLITKKAYNPERINNLEIKQNFQKYDILNYNQLINNIRNLTLEEKELAYKILDKAMLNPKQLNFRDYQDVLQTIGEDIVEANYNQTPIDLKGALYKRFLEYDPSDIKSVQNLKGRIKFKEIRARCDVADQGDDYLAYAVYGVTFDNQAYLLDVIFTQEDQDITVGLLAKSLLKYNVKIFRPESNNGGRAFCKLVQAEYKKLGGKICVFKPYTQTLNKEARILSNSTYVQDLIHYPLDWKSRYREFYIDLKNYQRQGKNEHDDAEDLLTSIVEELTDNKALRGA